MMIAELLDRYAGDSLERFLPLGYRPARLAHRDLGRKRRAARSGSSKDLEKYWPPSAGCNTAGIAASPDMQIGVGGRDS
jgi:hypothetical protein